MTNGVQRFPVSTWFYWCPGAELNHRHCDFQFLCKRRILKGLAKQILSTRTTEIFNGLAQICLHKAPSSSHQKKLRFRG